MKELHVIFGSGQIGTRLAERLLAAGKQVRVLSRNPKPPKGADKASVDARDKAAAAKAAEGATVIYDTMNPPYNEWKTELLPMGAGSLHAAEVTGAKLVALDCLYMYEPSDHMSETSPMWPPSKKGQLRKELSELRMASKAKVAIVRASDFFGSNLAAAWFGDRFFQRAFAGKTTECLGDPDQPHSYTYAEDVVTALVQLGAVEETGIWHVPTLPAMTSRELAAKIGQALNLLITIKQMPPLVVRMAGVFVPFMRELPEMRYQWEQPFVIDDQKYRARFGTEPTPLAQQIAETTAWAKRTFGQKHAA
ncbi:MAG: NAD(P)-binding domain-containing protein [Kofleriaceae bacterium]